MADFIPVELKENIYAEIFVPLVGAYNLAPTFAATQRAQPNPHEVVLVAMYLKARTQYWGSNIPSAADSRRGDPECCLEPVVPMCCKNGIISGARADGPGAASPDTARTETLRKALDNLVMNQPNAWNQWVAGLDYFFKNIGPYLNYFIYKYKDGRFSDFYEHTAGVFRHPAGYKSGIEFGNVQEGIAGIPATAGESVLSILPGIDSSFENKYFEIYTSAGEILVPWINFGDSAQPVVAPPPGIGVQYFETIMVDPGGIPQATYAQQLADALTLAPGITATKTGVANVTVVTDLVGSRPATDYTNWDDVGKTLGVFVDGTDAGVSQAAIDCWQLWCRADNQMSNRFVIMSDTLGATWLFYWNLDGGGIPPVGVVADNIVSIPVTTGMSIDEFTSITATTVQDQGFVTAVISTGQDGNQSVIDFTYLIEAPVTTLDTGTASFGVNYNYESQLLGSDGSVLASGITNSQEYAEAWNEFKVAFEQTQGNTYPYLRSNVSGIGDEPFVALAVGGGSNCKNNCGVQGIDSGNAVYCDDGLLHCCRACSNATQSGLFSAIAYPSYPDTNYNTPGSIFIASEGRQANMTAIADLV